MEVHQNTVSALLFPSLIPYSLPLQSAIQNRKAENLRRRDRHSHLVPDRHGHYLCPAPLGGLFRSSRSRGGVFPQRISRNYCAFRGLLERHYPSLHDVHSTGNQAENHRAALRLDSDCPSHRALQNHIRVQQRSRI